MKKITYMAEKLKNPQAANDLLDKVEAAIMEVRRFLYNGQNREKMV